MKQTFDKAKGVLDESIRLNYHKQLVALLSNIQEKNESFKKAERNLNRTAIRNVVEENNSNLQSLKDKLVVIKKLIGKSLKEIKKDEQKNQLKTGL